VGCPLWVDAVDKVGDEQRTGNDRIQVPSFLNLYCAPDFYLESMLLTRPSKRRSDSIVLVMSALRQLYARERKSLKAHGMSARCQIRTLGMGSCIHAERQEQQSVLASLRRTSGRRART